MHKKKVARCTGQACRPAPPTWRVCAAMCAAIPTPPQQSARTPSSAAAVQTCGGATCGELVRGSRAVEAREELVRVCAMLVGLAAVCAARVPTALGLGLDVPQQLEHLHAHKVWPGVRAARWVWGGAGWVCSGAGWVCSGGRAGIVSARGGMVVPSKPPQRHAWEERQIPRRGLSQQHCTARRETKREGSALERVMHSSTHTQRDARPSEGVVHSSTHTQGCGPCARGVRRTTTRAEQSTRHAGKSCLGGWCSQGLVQPERTSLQARTHQLAELLEVAELEVDLGAQPRPLLGGPPEEDDHRVVVLQEPCRDLCTHVTLHMAHCTLHIAHYTLHTAESLVVTMGAPRLQGRPT